MCYKASKFRVRSSPVQKIYFPKWFLKIQATASIDDDWEIGSSYRLHAFIFMYIDDAKPRIKAVYSTPLLVFYVCNGKSCRHITPSTSPFMQTVADAEFKECFETRHYLHLPQTGIDDSIIWRYWSSFGSWMFFSRLVVLALYNELSKRKRSCTPSNRGSPMHRPPWLTVFLSPALNLMKRN